VVFGAIEFPLATSTRFIAAVLYSTMLFSFSGNEFYVCDFSGHAVVVFGEDGSFKRRFESKLKSDWYPGGIVVADDEMILIGFSSERRFQVVGFNRLGQELFYSRCPPRRVRNR